MNLLFALLVLAAGCAGVFYPERHDYALYRVIVASPSQVSAHCHNRIARYTKMTGQVITHDDGQPIPKDEEIRACADFKTPGKPTVFVSRKWRRCERHEACHALKLGTPEWCDRNYPCLGERR